MRDLLNGETYNLDTKSFSWGATVGTQRNRAISKTRWKYVIIYHWYKHSIFETSTYIKQGSD